MDDNLKLLNRIKQERLKAKLSQAMLAEKAGVSRNTIRSIECGQYTPSAKLAFIICIIFEKKFEELFYFEE